MKQGQVRIIGGKWRGRRLTVATLPGLRPTPDRVRETVFNWLTPYIAGARCLDAFAGSGVLGFEALSRGAAEVVMVDESADAVDLLQKQLQTFDEPHAEVYCASLPQGLKGPLKPFDIIFLDPPYDRNLLIPTCHYLESQHFLTPSALIYLEARLPIQHNELPSNWEVIKNKQAGQVFYHLARRKETKDNE